MNLKEKADNNIEDIKTTSRLSWMFTSLILAITLAHFEEYGFVPIELTLKEDLIILFRGIFHAIVIWSITFIILFAFTKLNDKINRKSTNKEENK